MENNTKRLYASLADLLEEMNARQDSKEMIERLHTLFIEVQHTRDVDVVELITYLRSKIGAVRLR